MNAVGLRFVEPHPDRTPYRYVVLGAGRQGMAAAYDLALRGGAGEIVLADASAKQAADAVRWLDRALPAGERPVLRAATLDAADKQAMTRALEGADAAISALPYRFNLWATRAAIAAKAPLCDLGGHTGMVRQQLALGDEAKRAGVAVVPDCGQAPGMATSLMVLATTMIDSPEVLEVWDGGLPLDPPPPLGYQLLFSIEGLTNEYDGLCTNIREGKVVELESLSHDQIVEFPPPLGRLEAFCASGTTSTFPWTYEGRLRELTSRILRYPGHLAAIRTLKTLGFFGQEPVTVDGQPVRPRRLTEALLEKVLASDRPVKDIVIVRVHCSGTDRGAPARAELDCFVRYDEVTGLTAMQRCTGFDAAIVAAMLAAGEIAPGVFKREEAVDPERYVAEITRRDMEVVRRVVLL